MCVRSRFNFQGKGAEQLGKTRESVYEVLINLFLVALILSLYLYYTNS